MSAGWQQDPRQYPPTVPGQPQYPPPPYGYQQQPQAYVPRHRPDDRRTVTYQTGSTGFHLTMTILTGGLWGIFVWPFCRRKVRVTTRYR